MCSWWCYFLLLPLQLLQFLFLVADKLSSLSHFTTIPKKFTLFGEVFLCGDERLQWIFVVVNVSLCVEFSEAILST